MPRIPSRLAYALALALPTVILLPGLALGHAELVSSTPGDGATVQGSPASVVVSFSEAITAESTLELRAADGATIATGGVDPADPNSLRIAAPALQPGTYEARATWFSSDGHGPDRHSFTFTVVPAPTPTPSPTPAPTEQPSSSPSPAPTPTADPSPTPTPTGEPTDPTAGAGDVLVPILTSVAILGALGAYLLRRRGVRS